MAHRSMTYNLLNYNLLYESCRVRGHFEGTQSTVVVVVVKTVIVVVVVVVSEVVVAMSVVVVLVMVGWRG